LVPAAKLLTQARKPNDDVGGRKGQEDGNKRVCEVMDVSPTCWLTVALSSSTTENLMGGVVRAVEAKDENCQPSSTFEQPAAVSVEWFLHSHGCKSSFCAPCVLLFE
jgi:hypothetical protein